jgi:hypothetical protein
LIVFVDESGLSERPTRVRTWAPKGQTPIIQFHFNWTHVSAIAGLTRNQFMFRLHEGSIKKEEIVAFLKALRDHLKQPLLVIWDGLKAHRSHLVRDYVDATDGGIQIAFLSAPTRLISIPSSTCGPGSSVMHWRTTVPTTLPNFTPHLAQNSRARKSALQSSPPAGNRRRCGDVVY